MDMNPEQLTLLKEAERMPQTSDRENNAQGNPTKIRVITDVEKEKSKRIDGDDWRRKSRDDVPPPDPKNKPSRNPFENLKPRHHENGDGNDRGDSTSE
jgi:hypothetical protein